MDKYDYIENIVIFLRGVTGINFQIQIKNVLYDYYKSIGKQYEMPDFYGGDDKNDGCIISDGIFYQIYSPTRLTSSLKKNIQDKFTEDLNGLLEIIYKEKKWGGKLKEFIFLINTQDNNLPHDSERFFDKKVIELKRQYGIDFNYRVVNTDYIKEILQKIDNIDILKSISASMRIKSLIDVNAVNEKIIIDLIISISGNLADRSMIDNLSSSYDRVSPSKKIDINGLTEIKKEIETIIAKLDVVEKSINIINQNIIFENKFERVKNFIIDKYNKLSETMSGVSLYEALIDDVLLHTQEVWNLKTPMKFLIIYIFDKCDIFEKVDNINDSTQ